MEPSEGFDSSGVMVEMIYLFIAALGCMTTILPCCRALVLQCSSPPTMASSRFPLACLLLLTVVFALLASAPTPNLPVLLVPPATSLPLATCCSTPHVPACKLPCSETFQFGGARVQELHGRSTCSLGESWDLKHAAEFEAPLYGLVWDDLPHSSPHDITPSPPAPAGPFLSFLWVHAPLIAAPHWGRSSRLRRAVCRAPAAHASQPCARPRECQLYRQYYTRTKPTASRQTILGRIPRALRRARGGNRIRILSTWYAPTSTRTSGVANPASGGYYLRPVKD